MIAYAKEGSFKGKTVAISGSGNVAQYAALKAIELGATVVSLSDSKGSVIATAEDPITPEDIEQIAGLKLKRQALTEFKHEGKYKYIDGARPWTHVKVDVALPCATQNEVSKEEAEALVASGARFIAEGSNMGCTQDAIDVFEAHRGVGPHAHQMGQEVMDGGTKKTAEDNQDDGAFERALERRRAAGIDVPPERQQGEHADRDMHRAPGLEAIHQDQAPRDRARQAGG